MYDFSRTDTARDILYLRSCPPASVSPALLPPSPLWPVQQQGDVVEEVAAEDAVGLIQDGKREEFDSTTPSATAPIASHTMDIRSLSSSMRRMRRSRTEGANQGSR